MRTFFGAHTAALALGALCIATLTHCSSYEDSQPAASEGNRYGSYLAGRFAASERDAASAALYYGRALRFDPGNPELLERVLVHEVARGEVDGAASYASALLSHKPGERTARLVLGVKAMRDGDYAAAEKSFENAGANAFAEIGARLGAAYAATSAGEFPKAKAAIAKLAEMEGARPFALYHLAVMEDLSGLGKDALAHFEEAHRLSNGESLRILLAYSAHAARMGDTAKAKEILDGYLKEAPANPLARAALAQLASGKAPPRVIGSGREGLAETFYGLASSLREDRDFELPVFYLQLALALAPGHELAISLLVERLENVERWQDAIDAAGRIPQSSPLYLNARQQIARGLLKLEKPAEAMKILEAALKGTAADAEVHDAIGDLLRSGERYSEAAEAYSKAIALIGEPQPRHWALFYTRGIAYERSNRWKLAEADLKLALKLKPEDPLVLNYLAYSWVEQGVNTAEALTMLKRAVELRPEDGFIVDSLGWAYYRLGDYRSAIAHLEQAIVLEPGEATINDHLGDAYWQVGRRLEARYQWQHALMLKPSAEDAARIQRKVEAGIEGLSRTTDQAGSPKSAQ